MSSPTPRQSAYSLKLRDPRWQKRRLQILERDEWRCQMCFDDEKTLHVHHLYYDRGSEPWDYPDSALKTLCEPCHESETAYAAEVGRNLFDGFRRKGFLANDLFRLDEALATMVVRHVPEVLATALGWLLTCPGAQDKMLHGYFAALKEAQGYGQPKPEDAECPSP